VTGGLNGRKWSGTGERGVVVDDQLRKQIRYQTNNGHARARQLNDPSTLTEDEWQAILLSSEGNCAYCGKYFGLNKLVLEHRISLGFGVGNIAENVAAACGRCNRIKAVNYGKIGVRYVVTVDTNRGRDRQIIYHYIDPHYRIEIPVQVRPELKFIYGYVSRAYSYRANKWRFSRMVNNNEIQLVSTSN
jgi:5-methylcytosine-specific restriction endonuclease McrA